MPGKFHNLSGNFAYGKFSKILSTLLFLFSYKMLVFRAEIHKMLIRIANREDPDQTGSALFVFFVQVYLTEVLEHLP